jgi:hypothetical protein
MPVPPEVMT